MTPHVFKLSCFVLVAVATPLTSPAMAGMVPGDNTVSAAARDQSAPAIARGGDKLLAVWSDARAIVSGGYEGETYRDIYGARLDLDDNLLDTVPIAIAAGKCSQENPKVAWNGTNWLVVFESWVLNGRGYYHQKSLEAVRVAPTGQVLGSEPIKLYGLTPSAGSHWALASDGTNCVVANQSSSTSGDILAVRSSPDVLIQNASMIGQTSSA